MQLLTRSEEMNMGTEDRKGYARCEVCRKVFSRAQYEKLEWYDHPLCSRPVGVASEHGEPICCGGPVSLMGWDNGVQDAIRVIQDRIDYFARQPCRQRGVLEVLEEVKVQVEAMLSRGDYSIRSPMMQSTDELPDPGPGMQGRVTNQTKLLRG